MLDDTSHHDGSDRPTWDDIEATLQYQIKSYTEFCNGLAAHSERCFESAPKDIQNIGASAGNLAMINQIKGIIAELEALDPNDPCFQQFIKHLRLRAQNYERTH